MDKLRGTNCRFCFESGEVDCRALLSEGAVEHVNASKLFLGGCEFCSRCGVACCLSFK